MSLFSTYSPKWFTKGMFNPEIKQQSDSIVSCADVMLCPGIATLVNTVWYYNGNTVGAIKYIGTNDAFDLPIYSNGLEVARARTTGNFRFNGLIESAASVASINPTARLLYDSGANPVVDYDAQLLYDNIGARSIDWGGRQGYDSTDNFVYTWTAGNFGVNQMGPTSKFHVTGVDNLSTTSGTIFENAAQTRLAQFFNNGSWRVSGDLNMQSNSNLLANYQISAQSTNAAGIAIDGASFSALKFFRLGVASATFQMNGVDDFGMYFHDLYIVNRDSNLTELYKNNSGQFLFSPLGLGIVSPNAPVTTVATTINGSTNAFSSYNSAGTLIYLLKSNGHIGAGATGGATQRSLTIGFNSAPFVDYNNTAIGVDVMSALAAGGTGNTAIGALALTALTTGAYNVSVGMSAGSSLTIGTNNTIVGWNALAASIGGLNNAAFGYSALQLNTASENTAIGAYSFAQNVGGARLSAVGFMTFTLNTSGNDNTAIGYFAGNRNVTGSRNTNLGASAGYWNVAAGSDNVFVGFEAGYDNNDTGTNGGTVGRNRNVFLGSGSGRTSTSDDSVFIGYNAGTTEANNNRFILANNTNTLLYGRFDTIQLGIGASPNSVAILDLPSTTLGFLPPRMTTAQRNAIAAVEGLIVYDTTIKTPFFYDGTNWVGM